MPKRSIRFPDDLATVIQTQADQADRSFSYLVIEACRTRYLAPIPPIGQDAENERAHRDARPERILERPTPRQMPRSEMRLQSYELPEPPRPPDAKAPRDARDTGTPLPSIAPRRTP